jgi:hypothetical protein
VTFGDHKMVKARKRSNARQVSRKISQAIAWGMRAGEAARQAHESLLRLNTETPSRKRTAPSPRANGGPRRDA